LRTRIHNIATHLPGVKSAAKHTTTSIEAWETFFTEEMLQLIVECTNLEIQRIRENYSRERNANPTNIVELKAPIGLLFLQETAICKQQTEILSCQYSKLMGKERMEQENKYFHAYCRSRDSSFFLGA
jgi:hypothetical protein